jgi:YD repeat-containing protein
LSPKPLIFLIFFHWHNFDNSASRVSLFEAYSILIKTEKMKKIVMIVSVAIASIGFSYAQQGQQEGQHQEGQMQQEGMTRELQDREKEKIEENELPGTVQNQLRTGEFSDWEIDEVFRIEPAAKEETGVAYEVKVERDDQEMRLHYDESGNLVGQKSKGDKKGRK